MYMIFLFHYLNKQWSVFTPPQCITKMRKRTCIWTPWKKFLEYVIYLEHKSFWHTSKCSITNTTSNFFFYPSEYQLSFGYLFKSILNLKLNSTNELQPRVLSFSATKYLFSVLRSSKTVRILIPFSIKLCNPKQSKESNKKEKQRSTQGGTDCSSSTFDQHTQPAAGSTTTVKQWTGPIISVQSTPRATEKPDIAYGQKLYLALSFLQIKR